MLCRKLRIMSEIDPLCFQVQQTRWEIFSRTRFPKKHTLTVQLIQHQDDKGEAAVTPSVFSASSCGCSSVFWRRRALLSGILVCAYCVPPERQNIAMSRKNHGHSFSKAMAWMRCLLTRKTALLWSSSSGGVAAQPLGMNHCGPVCACVHACVLRWTRWCCEMDNSSSFFRPSRCDGYASSSSSGVEICMNQCLFWVNSSSNEDGALMYSPTGLKELNSVFRWKSSMKICCFSYFIILETEKIPV